MGKLENSKIRKNKSKMTNSKTNSLDVSLITRISEEIKNLKWVYKKGKKTPSINGFPENVNWDELEDWPMHEELNEQLIPKESDKNVQREKERTASHVRGVVASINELISGDFELTTSGDSEFDKDVQERLRIVRRFCLMNRDIKNRISVIQNKDAIEFATKFLRVAALYHDIGKIIDSDRHVSRGVHLMRDVNEEDRKAFEHELMGGGFEDKHNFWTLLSHHDIFGCLCTGEGSLPALSQMVSWSGDKIMEFHKSPAALVSYLVLLNTADGDSSLRFVSKLNGLRTVEAKRYLEDWETVKNMLWDDNNKMPNETTREQFRESLLSWASHPETTIERITRLITTSYRMQVSSDLLLDESEVRKLVEDELEMLHGARLQMFCYLFARFCKIDYGRRFFDVVMLFELLDRNHGLCKRADGLPCYEYPKETPFIEGLSDDEWASRRSACLKAMTRRTCSILKRLVDDYGSSVKGDPRVAPLMSIVMANLMPGFKPKTVWAICRALKEHEARALAWISEEVAVSPYAG